MVVRILAEFPSFGKNCTCHCIFYFNCHFNFFLKYFLNFHACMQEGRATGASPANVSHTQKTSLTLCVFKNAVVLISVTFNLILVV